MTVGELKKYLNTIDGDIEVIVARSHGDERGSSLTWAPSLRYYQETDVGHSTWWTSCNAHISEVNKQYLIGDVHEVFALYIR